MTGPRSSAALFSTDLDGVIHDWNAACEQLTGLRAEDAVGRHCWEAIRGENESGLVCHRRCSIRRELRAGRATGCGDLAIRTPLGPRRVAISTILLHDRSSGTVLHVVGEQAARAADTPRSSRDHRLTPRQRDVLGLLVDGVDARRIAARLGLAESTVRNHIQAILRTFGCHSQLEAVARARSSL